jgi:hypothetical protein
LGIHFDLRRARVQPAVGTEEVQGDPAYPCGRYGDALRPGVHLELAPGDLKRGIVKTEELRQKAVETMRAFLKTALPEAEEKGLVDSPIKGAKGNLEFLWLLKKK